MTGSGAGSDTVLASRHAYRGRLISLRVDTLRTAGGHTVEREVVEHPGAIAIVALDDAGRVLLVRQYRHPVGRATLEVPAGTLHAGEDPTLCARRELAEETGLAARDWRLLTRICPSPGYCTEAIWLYLATGLHVAAEPGTPDADEDITVERLPLAEALDRIARGEIADGKTAVALLLAAREREANRG